MPLAEIGGDALANELVETLVATDRDHQVKPALDAFFLRDYALITPMEAKIRALMALILNEQAHELSVVSAHLGIAPHALRRLAARHFGFPPKQLMLRARFLRSFVRVVEAGEPLDYSKISDSYFDASHFLRDARVFLGTTPRRFVTLPTRSCKPSLRARAAVLGAATQALQAVPPAAPENCPTPPLDASPPTP